MEPAEYIALAQLFAAIAPQIIKGIKDKLSKSKKIEDLKEYLDSLASDSELRAPHAKVAVKDLIELVKWVEKLNKLNLNKAKDMKESRKITETILHIYEERIKSMNFPIDELRIRVPSMLEFSEDERTSWKKIIDAVTDLRLRENIPRFNVDGEISFTCPKCGGRKKIVAHYIYPKGIDFFECLECGYKGKGHYMIRRIISSLFHPKYKEERAEASRKNQEMWDKIECPECGTAGSLYEVDSDNEYFKCEECGWGGQFSI